MNFKQLTYSENIDRFLILKKEEGIAADKIKIYLNLLKFLAEHLAKKEVEIRTIDDARAILSQIKFDGLENSIQKEYFKLFIEFINFCQVQSDGRVQEPTGSGLKRKAVPTQYHDASKKAFTQIKTYDNDGKTISLKRLLLMLLPVVGLFGLIFFVMKQDGNKDSSSLTMQLIIDRNDLKEYVDSMSAYVRDIEILTDGWKKVDTTVSDWNENFENALANLILLSDKIGKIKAPEELSAKHSQLQDFNQKLVMELSDIKSDLRAQAEVPADSKRSGRAFNNVILMMEQIDQTTRDYVKLLKNLCDFNKAQCNL